MSVQDWKEGLRGPDGEVRCLMCDKPEGEVEVLLIHALRTKYTNPKFLILCPDCIKRLQDGLEEYISQVKFKGQSALTEAEDAEAKVISFPQERKL